MNKFIFFVGGLTIGFVSGWYFAKDKYEKMAQEEIDSVKNTFKKRDDERKEKKTYEKIISDSGYSQSYRADIRDRKEKTEMPDKKEKMSKPYRIPPEEFGEFEDYTLLSLTYYADGILADDINEPIGDLAGTIGEDFADGFGEYTDDAVYIRNDDKCCDYEILRVLDTYRESKGE